MHEATREIGRRLRAARRARDLRQLDVAAALGCAVNTVAAIERTGRGRYQTVAAYAALVGVSLDAAMPATGEAA